MIYNLETVLKYYIVIVSVVDALHFSQLFFIIIYLLCSAYQVYTTLYPPR